MATDMSKLAIRLGTNLEIPHLLKSKRGPIESYYDEATRDIVRGATPMISVCWAMMTNGERAAAS